MNALAVSAALRQIDRSRFHADPLDRIADEQAPWKGAATSTTRGCSRRCVPRSSDRSRLLPPRRRAPADAPPKNPRPLRLQCSDASRLVVGERVGLPSLIRIELCWQTRRPSLCG
jgi:hypothetical protein